MKLISWNVRGINASDKRLRVKQQLDSSQADILLLQETKLSNQNYHKTVQGWPKWHSAHSESLGASGGLATLWNPKTVIGQLVSQGPNWQLLSFQHYNLSFMLFNIYGPSSTVDKGRLG